MLEVSQRSRRNIYIIDTFVSSALKRATSKMSKVLWLSINLTQDTTVIAIYPQASRLLKLHAHIKGKIMLLCSSKIWGQHSGVTVLILRWWNFFVSSTSPVSDLAHCSHAHVTPTTLVGVASDRSCRWNRRPASIATKQWNKARVRSIHIKSLLSCENSWLITLTNSIFAENQESLDFWSRLFGNLRNLPHLSTFAACQVKFIQHVFLLVFDLDRTSQADWQLKKHRRNSSDRNYANAESKCLWHSNICRPYTTVAFAELGKCLLEALTFQFPPR